MSKNTTKALIVTTKMLDMKMKRAIIVYKNENLHQRQEQQPRSQLKKEIDGREAGLLTCKSAIRRTTTAAGPDRDPSDRKTS